MLNDLSVYRKSSATRRYRLGNRSIFFDRTCVSPYEAMLKWWLFADSTRPFLALLPSPVMPLDRTFYLVLCILLVNPPAVASEDDTAALQLFEKKIRPVLVEHCYECHSSAAEEAEGGLLLDSRDGVRLGGDSGPAVVVGDIDASLLISAIKHESYEMPPDRKLPDHVITDFERWIAAGAHDPRDGERTPRQAPKPIDLNKARDFWAFRPLQDFPSPQVARTDWPRSDIDHFVLSRLESSGMHPVADADPYTLLRRLTIDLTGLPPSADDIEAFVAEAAVDLQTAVETTADRLLSSPEFGKRWGRHWLDVARYADSNGGGVNMTFDNAWRYRDYVIAAFNDDKPYDVFVHEQIAGDLLPFETDHQRTQQLVATGFLMLGPKPLAKYDKAELKMDVVDDQLDTLGRTLLGLTVGCARCHDHKFDPISTKEYYSLAGIFSSTVSVLPPNGGGPISKVNQVALPIDESHQPWFEPRKEQLAEPEAMAVAEEAEPHDLHVRIRGINAVRGELAPRGMLMACSLGESPEIPAGASGRLQLAKWLTDQEQGAAALTARVMVNRVWKHLFGKGIVPSVDNFGLRGQAPSHPELLDTLSADFIADGWSVKQLIRRIVTCRTYRLSSNTRLLQEPHQESASLAPSIDPENRLLSHANGRRLDVEVIRDSILAVSGQLDPRAGGPTLPLTGRLGIPEQVKPFEVPRLLFRRAVYLPIMRGAMADLDSMDMLETFDFANPSMVTGNRDATTVPTQALFLLNSDFVWQQARHSATQLLEQKMDDAARVRQFILRALGRPASESEVQRGLELVTSLAPMGEGTSSEQRTSAWTVFCQSVLCFNEFLFLN